MKISIAMTTYNGAKYIKEQLLSFANQTVMPHELIVCDDGSTDKTIHIIKEFQKEYPFEIKIFINKNKLGYAQNFSKALSLTTGDIIFLSDQDDVWFDNKIQVCLGNFENNKDKQVLIHDAVFTDSKLNATNHKKYNFYDIRLDNCWHYIYNRGGISGNCLVVKKSFLELVLPIPQSFCHDEWLGLVAYNLDLLLPIKDVLVKYRRHENTASSISIPSKSLIFNIYKAYKYLNYESNPIYYEQKLSHINIL